MWDYVGYVANVFIFASASSVTLNPKLSLKPHLFFGFLIGHILWLAVAISRLDWPLIMLNVFFVILDIFGIVMRTFFKNKNIIDLFRSKS